MSTVEQPLNKIAATLVDLQERYAKALEVVEAARHVANANGRNTKWHPAICIERSGRFGEDETIKCVCGLDGMRTALAAFDESSE